MAGGKAGPRRRPMTLAEAGPGTENERLGVIRLSMFENPLIIKHEVGKPLRNCYSLPGLDFTYGMYVHKRDGGVAEAIGHWDSIKPRNVGLSKAKLMPRDFLTMNRGAVEAGCTTAPEFRLYYKYMDIRLKDENRFLSWVPKIPDMTFGRPARPSTPIYDIIQHRYKEMWMERQRARTRLQIIEKKKLDQVRGNRTTYLRTHPPPVKEESFWHPARFEKVEPHLSTFPDPEAREKALSASH
ncbi:cilia- and flagella-associated protein 77 [Neopelma chrysocephalum]|uniref:cilia- and flagella-associated protein 77 n=1 Tax=Neopelma chrysocephalum TaxID=114329 RepID=UPI000FCCE72C|nr:cilia- and flagella-associated protein 77 [Neopelma chrysocephalum]